MKVKNLFDEFEKISIILISLKNSPILEAKCKVRGIRVDNPHFSGDKKHAHCDLGRFQVCWDSEYKRKHENKFPKDSKEIPWAAKQAVAKKLGLDPNLLEAIVVNWFVIKQIKKDGEAKVALLVEVDEKSSGKQI